ncbi:TetR/AcrR family transcriptional regulator [Nocardioides marinquilinus]|uniref:TetR/AcrR family transcriptional regulator n=1 Tax=Nocardioides marinquilinus TaxID=1210400 RepID=A0ABP9PBL0_9ACTN
MDTTFARTARREQLVEVTIDLLAEVGVEGSSYLRIAERAGISRGVLNYHFGGRAELFSAVVDTVYARGVDEVLALVEAAPSPGEALAAFVRGSVHFYAARRRELRALTAIYTSRAADTVSREQRSEHRREIERVGALLRAGQEAGQLRAFDVDLMTACLRSVLDLAVALTDAGADPGPLADELVRTVHAMTST